MKKVTNRVLRYNSEKKDLIIPEYGRHIHSMVDYAKTIEDQDERSKVAKAIIGVMGNLSPHLRNVPEFQHKLWDQLFIIANFELDVDCPYEKISKDIFEKRPEPLKYPQRRLRYRFYGHNVLKMIDKIDTIKEEKDKKEFIRIVANFMKRSYVIWNRGTVEDTIVIKHLQELYKKEMTKELLPTELESFERISNSNGPQKSNLGRKPYQNTNKKYKKYSKQ